MLVYRRVIIIKEHHEAMVKNEQMTHNTKLISH